jgi:glyceraldehyde-3-phosphate dehydrogenase (NADP+)
MKRYPLRIGDELRETSTVELITSPFDGSPIAEVCIAGEADLEDAIELASRSAAALRDLPTHARAAILERCAAGIAARAEELARLISLESGKPLRFSRAEVERAQLTFTLAAGEARSARGEVLPIDLQPRAEGRLCLSTRVPRGPVAAIAPFNFPLNLVAHKLAPAIAIGTTVVLKPAPQAPLSALELAAILAEAGLPAGGLSVVPCPPATAQRLVEDERLKVLSFTGSDAVGWKLKGLAGKKHVLLELGGNAPCIVDAGVDLDAILTPIVLGAWANAGQVCIKLQRLHVHASLYEEFLTRFLAATRALPCGDPLDPETIVGPLIEAQHVARVLSWVHEAVEAGARLHCGGEAHGSVVLPTILTDVTADLRVCKDEVFGPVTIVEPFERFEDALATCNASRFGLQAGVFTRDLSHALQAHHELDYGGVLINEVPTFRVDNVPYGGTKDSGSGREGVRSAMDELSESKVLILRGLST